jgi:hypothetical protein
MVQRAFEIADATAQISDSSMQMVCGGKHLSSTRVSQLYMWDAITHLGPSAVTWRPKQ